MKISGIDKKETKSKSVKGKIQGGGDFSLSLDLANRENAEQNLKYMLEEISKAGKKLIATRSVEDAKEYKRRIQDYLSFILKNVYVLRREPGPFNYGIHIRIEIINDKLDNLTKELISEQRETIQIAEKIEEIRGLLVDVYK